MDKIIGTWLATELFADSPDSGKFIKFKEDKTFILNDGLEQIESTYETQGDAEVSLKPALGMGHLTEAQYNFKVEKNKEQNEVLILSKPDKGIILTYLKKSEN